VRLGDMENLVLEFDGLRLPVGLYDSTLISCDIGRNVAVHHVAYLAHTLVGDEVILHNLGRMLTTPRARFGCGTLGEGEEERACAWLEIANEGGDRRVLAFPGMLAADAWLWSKFRAEAPLLQKFKDLTDRRCGAAGGRYGTIGDRTVIRDTRSIVDAAIGSDAYIEGADRLESVTIQSDAGEGTRIGEGVCLSEGIVGHGCEVSLGARATRFVLGTRARLSGGARLTHTWLGDNSQVACGEVGHSLIFPNFEQHHKSSFLIAATIEGQSNIAAGATIGSNHNSRANDGELVARRGFWPGLCANFKHPSRFAPFTLVAKGSYAHELDIPLPFSLVANDEHAGCLQVMPAYWFLHNMYALARNGSKFRARDKRIHRDQHLEFDYLAPDTVEAMITALALLESWTAEAWLCERGESPEDRLSDSSQNPGRDLLLTQPEVVRELKILGQGLENSSREVRILKAAEAYGAYREMIQLYAVKTLVEWLEEREGRDFSTLSADLGGERERQWFNLGGQPIGGEDLARLKEKIVLGQLESWDEVHDEYDRLWKEYPAARARHAFAALLELHDLSALDLDARRWAGFLDQAAVIQDSLAERIHASRAKDTLTPLRQITFDSPEERDAVLGPIDENAFIVQARAEAAAFRGKVARLREGVRPAVSRE